MSDTTAGLLQVGALLAALAAVLPPARRLHGPGLHERARTCASSALIYRLVGVDPEADQRWSVYAASRARLLARRRGAALRPAAVAVRPAAVARVPRRVDPALAFNTAASFVTNTNWQSYSGEATMGHLTQMAGLAVQNFVSAAVGMAVAVALIRGFARSRTDRLGNFWVDLVRGTSSASCCRWRWSAPSR